MTYIQYGINEIIKNMLANNFSNKFFIRIKKKTLPLKPQKHWNKLFLLQCDIKCNVLFYLW